MALTWTCDNCGEPNFMNRDVCAKCGASRPSRYGKIIPRKKREQVVEKSD